MNEQLMLFEPPWEYVIIGAISFLEAAEAMYNFSRSIWRFEHYKQLQLFKELEVEE